MPKFSERIGAVQVPKIAQTESINDALRNTIWNFLISIYGDGESGWFSISHYVANFVFKVPVDELPTYNIRLRDWLKDKFYKLTWYEVYDLVEAICRDQEVIDRHTRWHTNQLHQIFNRMFETELSGYRFVEGILVPIASPAETESIEAAVESSSRLGLAGAHTHIITALQLLAKRPNPDYRNSIKESISAVESMVKQLSGVDSQGLSPALGALSKRVTIHEAMRSGFVKMYGYTSDEDGIRHAILEDSNVGYDEAKYMVVACSAFVNYVAAKAQAAGMLDSST
nr:hypothetical protein [uncultured Roseateles sp.]